MLSQDPECAESYLVQSKSLLKQGNEDDNESQDSECAESCSLVQSKSLLKEGKEDDNENKCNPLAPYRVSVVAAAILLIVASITLNVYLLVILNEQPAHLESDAVSCCVESIAIDNAQQPLNLNTSKPSGDINTKRPHQYSQSSNGTATTGTAGNASVPKKQHRADPSFLAFNQTNPHKHSWCPSASCHNSPMCSPCNRRYLFIVATGRSGSTTLLKMLDFLPNVRLSGENNNELFVASQLESNLRGAHFPLGDPLLEQEHPMDGAWMHNVIPTQSMACPIQQVVSTLNPPPSQVLHAVNETGKLSLAEYDQSTILGIKTIRLQASKWSPDGAADFFRENFPCSRIVVNIRSDIKSQVASMNNEGWESENESLSKENSFLKRFAGSLGQDMARLIDMTKWTTDVSILNDLLDWLGYEDCHYQSILHENHDGYDLDQTDPHLGEQCHYPY